MCVVWCGGGGVQKPEGILPSIDEELKMPKGTDQTWLEKLHKRGKGHPCYQILIKTPEKFVVKHYAGDVTYEVCVAVGVCLCFHR